MSEEPALDRRSPEPRKPRGAGIYVAYAIAGALLVGTGALSLGHLSSYRPAVQPPTASRPDAAAPKPPLELAQAQPPSPSPSAPPAPSPSVTVKMPDPKGAVPPPGAKPPAEPTPPAAAPAASSAPPAGALLPFAVSPLGVAVPPPGPPVIAAPDSDGPAVLIAANGLPLPPPEKPPVPGRRLGLCPGGTDPAGLVESSPVGRLPRIAADGCMPWLAYAADFDHLDRERPRLGLAVIGIGLSESLTQKAVETMPTATTLVFVPETPNLDRWILRARERGLEVVLLIPTQSPQGSEERGMPPVQTGLSPEENLRRLRAVLARATGYVGIALLPSPVREDAATLRALLTEVRDRGLLVLEFERWNGKSQVHAMSREMGIPYSTDIDKPIAWVDRFNANDRETTAADVDKGLDAVEAHVRSARFGLGWSLARPLAVDRIVAWAPGARARGILIAPVTGVTECAENCRKRLPRAPTPAAASTR